MNDTYFWYSNSSRETGTVLATALGMAHGTLPPNGFNGTIVCWGASPTSKFKWADRNFQALMNDPRKVNKYKDRKNIFDKLIMAGLDVVGCVPLTSEAQYSNICSTLAVPMEEGFVAAKENGTKARLVKNQSDLQTAINDECNRAIEKTFLSPEKLRVFVIGGKVVVSLRKAIGTDDTFLTKAAEEAFSANGNISKDTYKNVLASILSAGVVTAAKSYWAEYGVSTLVRDIALTAAKAMELDFAAIDIVAAGNMTTIINVVTTPNLKDTPSIQAPVVAALKEWVKNNSMTAKEILLSMIQGASEDEAVSILESLREQAKQLSATQEQ